MTIQKIILGTLLSIIGIQQAHALGKKPPVALVETIEWDAKLVYKLNSNRTEFQIDLSETTVDQSSSSPTERLIGLKPGDKNDQVYREVILDDGELIFWKNTSFQLKNNKLLIKKRSSSKVVLENTVDIDYLKNDQGKSIGFEVPKTIENKKFYDNFNHLLKTIGWKEWDKYTPLFSAMSHIKKIKHYCARPLLRSGFAPLLSCVYVSKNKLHCQSLITLKFHLQPRCKRWYRSDLENDLWSIDNEFNDASPPPNHRK